MLREDDFYTSNHSITTWEWSHLDMRCCRFQKNKEKECDLISTRVKSQIIVQSNFPSWVSEFQHYIAAHKSPEFDQWDLISTFKTHISSTFNWRYTWRRIKCICYKTKRNVTKNVKITVNAISCLVLPTCTIQ